MPVDENGVCTRHVSAIPSKVHRVILPLHVGVEDRAVIDGPPISGSVVLQAGSPGRHLLREQHARSNKPNQIAGFHRIDLECYTLAT